MMALTLLWTAPVLAAGLHAGIPVTGVFGLDQPTFLVPESGWTTPVNDGMIKVFVGHSQAQAADWAARQRESLTLGPPPAIQGYGDQAWGDAVGYLLVIDGNVGFAVQVRADADLWGARLLASIEDGPAWPAAPSLRCDAALLCTIEAPGAAALQFQGGRMSLDGSFSAPPRTVTVWDAWGRPTVAHYDASGHETAE